MIYAYWHGGNQYDIYIHIMKNNVNLTIPTYDIFDKKCIFSVVSQTSCTFFYYESKFVLDKFTETQLEFLVYNKSTNCVENVIFERITRSEYEDKSKVINRTELLLEPYQRKYVGDIKFIYKFQDEKLQYLKEIVHLKEWIDITSELASVKSILEWIGKYFFHNGKEPIPSNLDAISLIKYANGHGNKLNCRGLAVIAYELCLAVGLKAKLILCRQKEIKCDNSHYLIVVFITKYNKWVAFDPSYNIMFFDEFNNLLSLDEVRERLAHRKYIKLYDRIKYNQLKVSGELYIKSLIAKLYRITTPMEAYSGCDVKDNLISLVPDVSLKYDGKIIDCPEKFWML